jgi:hypothetical protein
MGVRITVREKELDRRALSHQADFLLPEAYSWFPDYLNTVKRQLKLIRSKLTERVRVDGPVALALFEMAILIGSRSTSEMTMSNLRMLAQIAGLAPMPLERYIDMNRHEDVSDPNSKEVDRLYKAVEQELTNRLADELETQLSAIRVNRATSTT